MEPAAFTGSSLVDGATLSLVTSAVRVWPAESGRRPEQLGWPRARATLGDREGWGLFELGTFGRHDPSGFVDYASVAP